MRILALLLCFLLPMSASALEIQAPTVPEEGRAWMSRSTDSLTDGIQELLQKAVSALRPDLLEAARVSIGIIGTALMISMLQSLSPTVSRAAEMAGIVAIAAMLLLSANSMIHLATDTIRSIGDYGKLLLGVMTTALAVQGGVTTSTALYAATAMFIAVLQSLMSHLLVPGIYLYLAFSAGSGATGEDLLKRTGDMIKGFLSWCLKILLMVFTTWLSLTHVISGTTDALALKAAKVSMSSFIPVVGGILSDASEAVLVSAGLMKNAAGIYGILAVLALFLHPFLQIGIHYLILKLTGGLCAVFSPGKLSGVIDAFSTAMGLLLAMTGSSCVMVLVSTVCFMKGVS